MKRIFLIYAILCLALNGWGQSSNAQVGYPTIYSDYRTLYDYLYEEWLEDFEEGFENESFEQKMSTTLNYMLKNWLTLYRSQDGILTKKKLYILPTDTIIDGRTYAQITCARDTLLFRQAGDKVYYRSKNDGSELLLLDYGLGINEEFVSPQGTRFIVKSISNAESYESYGVKRWKYGPGAWFYGTAEPKILKLQSEDGQQEDTWIEGIGSQNWGILPPSLINDELSHSAHVIYAPGINMSARFTINEPDYIITYFEPEDIDYSRFNDDIDELERFIQDNPIRFHFSGDTLCITGVKSLNCYTAYAECLLKDNAVTVNIDQFLPMGNIPTCKVPRIVNVRIPGFKAGTYQVGMPGGERQEIICYGKQDNYTPFAKEGKVWTVGRYPEGDCRQTPLSLSRYYFDGDSIVDGRNYKRWMQDGKLRGLLYEEDRKVYFLGNDRELKLMYDFGLTQGGKAEVYSMDFPHAVTSYIDSISATETGLRRYTVYNDMGLQYMEKMCLEAGLEGEEKQEFIESEWDMITYVWIEGVGAIDYPDNNIVEPGLAGNDAILIEVRVNDDIIYNIPYAKWPTDDIDVVKQGATGTGKRTYNLSGRPVSGKPQRGLYIQGGRKVVHTRTQFNGRD